MGLYRTLDPIPTHPSGVIFQNRSQAAHRLAAALAHYEHEHPLVLGIPRGSVPMAEIVADRVRGDLDVVLVHKITSPEDPEYAIGAVNEFGDIFHTSRRLHSLGELERLARQPLEKLQALRKAYTPLRPPIPPEGRVVLIVDDGIATGATMTAALRTLRHHHLLKVVVATPVASSEACDRIENECDQLVVLGVPEEFRSVSQFYNDFPQVTDHEVAQALARAWARG